MLAMHAISTPDVKWMVSRYFMTAYDLAWLLTHFPFAHYNTKYFHSNIYWICGKLHWEEMGNMREFYNVAKKITYF